MSGRYYQTLLSCFNKSNETYCYYQVAIIKLYYPVLISLMTPVSGRYYQTLLSCFNKSNDTYIKNHHLFW